MKLGKEDVLVHIKWIQPISGAAEDSDDSGDSDDSSQCVNVSYTGHSQ